MTASLLDLVQDEADIAAYLNKGASTVRRWGCGGKLPPFYKPGRHKLFLRPVTDAWVRSDFDAVKKIKVDLSPYPALLTASELARVLRISVNRVYALAEQNSEHLPPRRHKSKEWATQDLVSWLAQGARVADLIEVVTRPIAVSPDLLAANATLAALTHQLQQSPQALRSSGRGR